jgi:hypothetical protein
MKTIQEIKKELLMLGVNQRLLELNQERDIIIKLAKSNDSSAKSNDIIKHVKEKKN